MSTIPQNKALEVIRDKVQQTPERYPGYRTDLLGTLVGILELEAQRPYQHVQQITRRIVALGERIEKKGGSNP